MDKISRPTKTEASNLMLSRVRQLRADMIAILAAVTADNYGFLVAWPSYAIRFDAEVTEFLSFGYSPEVIGPMLVEQLETDPTKTWASDYSSRYETFKNSVGELCGLIITNFHEFTPSLDARGNIIWATPISKDLKDQIAILVQTALDNVPGG